MKFETYSVTGVRTRTALRTALILQIGSKDCLTIVKQVLMAPIYETNSDHYQHYQDDTIDAIPVAFVNVFFDTGGLPSLDLSNVCELLNLWQLALTSGLVNYRFVELGHILHSRGPLCPTAIS